jgi:hypothetical protein
MIGTPSRSRLAAVRRVYMVVALVLACAPAAANAAAGPLSFSARRPIDVQPPFGSTQRITGFSCPSGAPCVAVDFAGNVLTSTNPAGGAGAWSAPVNLENNGNALDAVSCGPGPVCVLVDSAGNLDVSWIAGGKELAGGAVTYTRPGSRRLHIAVTGTGKRMLRQANGRLVLTVTVQGTFTPAGGGAQITERMKLSLA